MCCSARDVWQRRNILHLCQNKPKLSASKEGPFRQDFLLENDTKADGIQFRATVLFEQLVHVVVDEEVC